MSLISTQAVVAGVPAPLPQLSHAARFGSAGMPLDVKLHQNHVASRLFIETIGYYLWSILLSRNKFEALEKIEDLAAWAILALAIPLAITKGVYENGKAKKLAKAFNLSNTQPLNTRLEDLTGHALNTEAGRQKLATHWGLPANATADTVHKLAKRVRTQKFWILGIDLFFMAFKGQCYFWGRNWLTEKLSKKKGFVGEFKYTTDTHRDEKAQAYEAKKTRNMITSMVMGFGAALSLPIIANRWLANTTPILAAGGRTFAEKAKSALKRLNYHNVVYMSKWVMMWHGIFNWQLPGILSARDKQERREHILRSLSFDLFWILGDDIFAGVAAKVFSKRWKPEIPVHYRNKLGLPIGYSSNIVFDAIARGIKNAGSDAVHDTVKLTAEQIAKAKASTAFKIARASSWFGIFMTALFLGIGTTLVNNWMTHKKVMKELHEKYEPMLKKLQGRSLTAPLGAPSLAH